MTRALASVLTALAFAWFLPAPARAQPKNAPDVDPKVIEAWKKVGPGVYWYWEDPDHVHISSKRPEKQSSTPVFRVFRPAPGALGKLPLPAAEFGINWKNPTDADLK